tara:strand:- start:63 stop:1025 length:963 start_codon:yes stop_codon:yes gene_type:complete
LKGVWFKRSKPTKDKITMGVTSFFHNALILSIVEMTKENEDYSIFDFIKLMISETNMVLSPGARDFGPSPVSKYVQLHIEGKYSYPLITQNHQLGTPMEEKRNLYSECLIKIHGHFDGDHGVSWFDLLTYLLFIQSNCHHKGNPFSPTPKLCRNADSFLNFFYKSKSAFNPWSQWEKSGLRYTPLMDYIPATKTAELRGEWWVKAFEREKENFLMFETLAPSHYLGTRFTTGWIVPGFNHEERDILPQGSVLNQLRRHYELPELSGDYGLGCMSVRSNVLDGPEVKDKDEEIKLYNACDLGLASIGLVLVSHWLVKKMNH